MKQWAYRHLQGDPVIWVIAFTLSMLSILVVYSATGSLAYQRMQGDTEYYLIKHSLLTFFSLFVMWITHKIDYRYYYKLSLIALWVCVALLLFTLKFGASYNEATRWITIPFIEQSFQPSDLAKLALLVQIAGILAKHQKDPEGLKAAIVPILFWCALICGLIAISDISSAILVALTALLMMFIGRVPFRYLCMLATIVIFSGMASVFVGQRGKTAVARLRAFTTLQTPYQSEQSYIAIASGGLFGKGPGKSDQRHFLPYSYSDFIYAIIVEEYGFLGGMIILLLYIVLLYRGSKVLISSKRTFGGLLSASLCIAIAAQALVNMGVSLGVLPVTGLPLPLISMGGTSQLFTGISMGIILSVSRSSQDASPKANTFFSQEEEAEHVDERVDEHADERVDERVDEHADEHADERVDERVDEHVDGHVDRHVDGHADGHADKYTDEGYAYTPPRREDDERDQA